MIVWVLMGLLAVAQQFCSPNAVENTFPKTSDTNVTPVAGKGQIYAPAFDDCYFLPGQGLAESRYVFLQGCNLPSAWQNIHKYTIGELGFGTGLNFLAAWQAWAADPQRSEQLTFISIEAFPLSAAQIAEVHTAWPELAPYVEQLLVQYPIEPSGIHQMQFGNVKLILVFDDVTAALKQWPEPVDAWFLDGFKPVANPAMWSEDTMLALAKHSKPGTQVATFTAAGMVKRALTAAGFTVIKTPGFQFKRERITALYPSAFHN